MTIELAWPWLLAALPLPLLTYRLLPRAATRPGPRLRLPFYQAVAASLGQANTRRRPWRLLLAVLTWGLLGLATARPQFVGDPIALPVEGRDLMLAVDISGSMKAQDMVLGNRVTDRLTAVKAVAGDFIQRRGGDRLGLILFGARAYLQSPLSLDRTTVRTLLNESAVGLAGKETAIGDAIGLGIKRLRERDARNRVLILLTDGANTAGSVDPQDAAEMAAAAGVRVHTIGVGSDRGAFTGRGAEIDEGALRAIAATTGGRYFRARDIQGLAAIYKLLDDLEPVAGGEQTFRPRNEVYAWPLGAALVLSLMMGGATGIGGRLAGFKAPVGAASGPR